MFYDDGKVRWWNVKFGCCYDERDFRVGWLVYVRKWKLEGIDVDVDEMEEVVDRNGDVEMGM